MTDTQPLPERFPIGTKYVLEGRGRYVRRYVEYPDGRRIQLATRKALSCTCMEFQQIGISPGVDPDSSDGFARRERLVDQTDEKKMPSALS